MIISGTGIVRICKVIILTSKDEGTGLVADPDVVNLSAGDCRSDVSAILATITDDSSEALLTGESSLHLNPNVAVVESS